MPQRHVCLLMSQIVPCCGTIYTFLVPNHLVYLQVKLLFVQCKYQNRFIKRLSTSATPDSAVFRKQVKIYVLNRANAEFLFDMHVKSSFSKLLAFYF